VTILTKSQLAVQSRLHLNPKLRETQILPIYTDILVPITICLLNPNCGEHSQSANRPDLLRHYPTRSIRNMVNIETIVADQSSGVELRIMIKTWVKELQEQHQQQHQGKEV